MKHLVVSFDKLKIYAPPNPCTVCILIKSEIKPMNIILFNIFGLIETTV